MGVNITLPLLGSQKQGTKDSIISILSQQWPLSAREIYNQLKMENSNSITYQAAHKTIQQLLEQGVLEKQGQTYLLNKEWIEKLQELGYSLHSAYLDGRTPPTFGESSFSLNSLHEADMFILDFLLANFPQNEETIIWQWSHYWLPLFLSMKEYEKIKKIPRTCKIYCIVRGNTAVDRWCAEFWSKQGVQNKYGINYGNNDILVINDLVLQAFYPKEIMKEIDKFFEKTKSIQDIDVKYLFDNIFLKKTKIPIVVNRNPELAEQLRRQMLKHFEGDKNAK